MAKFYNIRKMTIYNCGRRLDVEIDYHYKYVNVYYIDDSKYFSLVHKDSIKMSVFKKMSPLDIRDIAINLKLF